MPDPGGRSGAHAVLIRGGEVVDPTGRRRADVLMEGDTVVAVEGTLDPPAGATVLDAGGCIVSSGLVDLHAHLRQPGREEAETVETGSRGAALGGYTAVCAMPNTTPPVDSASIVREVQELARDALCHVAPVGALTLGRRGERLAPYGEMAALGVRMFSDDGDGVQDNQLMRRAMEYARPLGVLLAQHCEDRSLAGGGVMHEGEWSARLGLPGQPAEAEELMVMRDVALCRLTGQPVHFLHVSTAGSVELVRRAKAAGLPVTAEATTHHLTLTDAACAGYDPVFKVHPPLRTDADVAAVRAGLLDGTVDAVATDHAPHAPETKDLPFDEAPPGMLGLETALALLLSKVGLPLERVLEVTSWRPARLGGLSRHGRPVAVGEPANLCVIDPAATWVVAGRAMASRSRNTPYEGWELTGRVRHTVYEGEPVVVDVQATR